MSAKVTDRDLGWRDILKAVNETAKGSSVKVGILADTDRGGLHRTDPTTGKAEELTIAEIALVNEYGTEDQTIPARPAHRSTFDRRREEIQREAFEALTKIVLDRTVTPEQALTAMGMKHGIEIRNTITAGEEVPPPNAPSTVRRKEAAGEWNKGGKAQAAGFGARTLVDTGATVDAISFAVELGAETKPAEYVKG